MTIFLICLPLIALLYFLHRNFSENFTFNEFLLATVATILLIIAGYFIALHGQTADVQILSGKVTGKEKDRVHCRHSYQCNCHSYCSGSGSNRSCQQVCQICYLHSHDFDWNVLTTLETIRIDTLDSQGLEMPPRWESVEIGEPVSKTDSYTNWLKAAPESVFRTETPIDPEHPMPQYPDTIFDYYKINRVVLDEIEIPQELLIKLNQEVSLQLRDVAAAKQVNLVIVITSRAATFANQLKAAWLNGRKNDLVVVIGSTKDQPLAIQWVESFGWSSNNLALISTRDDIRDHGTIDPTIISIAISNINKYWSRTPMSQYEYLKDEVELSTNAIFILSFVGLAAIGILTYVFIQKDIA